MKNKSFLAGIVSILLVFGFLGVGCSQPTDNNGGDTAVTFNSITADGSSTQTTTQLTLTFSQAITGLSVSDITLSGVSGVTKGTLSGSGPTYTLPISGFTSGGTLSVAVAKSGYAITGSPKTVPIYYYTSGSGDIAVTFNSVTADGSATQTTTQLILTFSQAITGFTAGDITLSGVSGVNKGTLSGSGPSYTLPISGFTVSGSLTVTVAKTGYAITGSPKTALIYYYNSNDTAVTFSSITADGSVAQTTTQLTLTFSQAIIGLSANDIILSDVSGVNKGTLSGSGPSYTLGISGFTSGGTLSVAVVKSGYTISGSPKTVPIYYYTSGGGGTESITLNPNGQWGWQAIYESDSLFNGNKITQGDEYTFTYSFTSDVPMDYLQVVLIDNGAQGNGGYRWVELSGYKKVKENIAANTIVSGTITITATGTATDTTALANRLVFQAGTGTANKPTLTFTTLSLENNGSGGGDTVITFSNVTADGSSTQTTTQLTLAFNQAIIGLSAGDITLSGVSGVNKGSLSGSGPTYTLPISGFTNGGTLSVAIAKSGYTINGSPKTVPIYCYASGGGDTAVTFSNVTADGSFSQTTTQLTLTFSQAITGLSAGDITLSGVSGVNKGTLSGSGPSYTLPISGFTSGGTLSVAIAKSGYTINGSPKTVLIYYYASGGGDTAVMFDGVFADGSPSQTTTQLTLAFRQDITDLFASDITLSGVSGVNKGTLTKDDIALYTLDISGFTSGGTLTVAVAKSGYAISGSPKTVTIYYYSDTAVTLSSVTANGSSSQTTTALTLTFSQAITGLSADDITLSGVSGVNKGTISGSGPVYTLPISGFTSGGTLTVAVAKSGYAISGSPKTVTINHYAISDGSEENPFPLTEGTWEDGNTTDAASTVWYSLSVTSGTAYNVWVNQSSGGDGTKTMATRLAGSYADGTYIFEGSSADISSPESFTADRDGIVKLKIYPYWNFTGTYAIGYSVSNTNVTLNSIIANGSATESTTQLTLTFDKAIFLNMNNITVSKVSGVTGNNVRVGPLIGSGNTYTLSIRDFYSSGTLSVSITPKSGYTMSNSPKTVDIYYNGVSWTWIDSGYFSPNAVTYGNGRFVGVGNASSAAYSANGTRWTQVTMSNTLTYTHVGIAYGYYRFVAVSTSGTMASSTDNGTSWSYMTGTMTTFGTTRINSIASNGSKFVAVGHSGKAAYATDSVVMGDWYAVSDMTFGTSNVFDVAYGGNRFVAVGQGGKAAYSSDGITWTAISDMKFGTSDIYGITYGNGKFVAVGENGKAAYSSDGITWAAISDMKFGNYTDIMNIAYGGGKYVAVGDGGKAAYSSDGITWTAVDYTGGTGTIDGIVYGNGMFVAVWKGGGMAYWVTP